MVNSLTVPLEQWTSNAGALYDPATDSWEPMSDTQAPTARYDAGAVWTGEQFVVWGGRGGGTEPLGDGGIYDPATNSWEAIPEAPLGERRDHTVVWTGEAILIWGGEDGLRHDDGALYYP